MNLAPIEFPRLPQGFLVGTTNQPGHYVVSFRNVLGHPYLITAHGEYTARPIGDEALYALEVKPVEAADLIPASVMHLAATLYIRIYLRDSIHNLIVSC